MYLHLPRPRARALGLLGIAWAAQSGCSEDACAANKSKIESCNRVFSRDVCQTPVDRCRTACWARVSCSQWSAVDDDGWLPPAVSQCLTKCVDTFVCNDGTRIRAYWHCDGAVDCADGSDEGRGCNYFHCDDGQAARESAECDDYPDCADGSDEERCR